MATNDGRRAPSDSLLSIGVFARCSRLSMKALRLYDRRGLLTPAHIDPDTGYRRYRESQLPARWLESRGLAASAPPREVYFTDFRSAGPDDEVCDVAFPIDSGEPGSC